MTEGQIKETLITLLDGIKSADGAVIARTMADLDAVSATTNPVMHPQLRHFLERRSYTKALQFLGGSAGTSSAS
jgi:hypothetical protein